MRNPGGWTSRRFFPGTNKEAFDVEVFALYQALRTFDKTQERGCRYTVFTDSTVAIERARSDVTAHSWREARRAQGERRLRVGSVRAVEGDVGAVERVRRVTFSIRGGVGSEERSAGQVWSMECWSGCGSAERQQVYGSTGYRT